MAIALESEAAFSDRLSKIGISQNVKASLLRQGFTTFGSLAFAISTTPAQMTDAAFETWVQKVRPDPLEPFQTACIRRLVFESHALALSDMQRKVDPVSEGLGLGHKKLPIAERQARQREQELRLNGLVLSPETLPSHALVDTCVNMVDTQVLVWIKPEECTSRAQEIQSIKKDTKLTLDNDGSLKMSAKTPAAVCQVSSELDLRNAFQRRSLALDQARVCSFRVIEKWVQHLFLAHGRSQPAGFANVTLSQMIECDKQLFVKASNELAGSLTAEPGQPKPLDAVIERLQTSNELQQFLMPLPTKNDNPNKRKSLEQNHDQQNKQAKGKGKHKGKSKGKGNQSTSGTISLPPGCVAKTPEGKPLCFGFNRGTCKFKGSGPRCGRGFHLCFKEGCHRARPYHECSHSE